MNANWKPFTHYWWATKKKCLHIHLGLPHPFASLFLFATFFQLVVVDLSSLVSLGRVMFVSGFLCFFFVGWLVGLVGLQLLPLLLLLLLLVVVLTDPQHYSISRRRWWWLCESSSFVCWFTFLIISNSRRTWFTPFVVSFWIAKDF